MLKGLCESMDRTPRGKSQPYQSWWPLVLYKWKCSASNFSYDLTKTRE